MSSFRLALGLLALPFLFHATQVCAAPIASRGTASVVIEEVDARAARVPPEKRREVFDSPARIEKVISALLLHRQLADEARALGLDKDPQAQIQLRLAADEVLASRRLDAMRAAPVLDAQTLAREVYLADTKQFVEPERVVVRHMLFDTKSHSESDARGKAETARAAAAKTGADFAALARSLSEDTTTREQGGLLPEFAHGVMEKSFEDAAFALNEPGQVSPLVKTQYGFHVIQLVERKALRQKPFEEVRDELVARVTREQSERSIREHIDKLQNMETTVDAEGVQSLRTRYANKPTGNGSEPAVSADAAAPVDLDAAAPVDLPQD